MIEGLIRLRKKAGYNKTGMAHSAGMKPRTWSDWEDDPPDALQWLVNLARHHKVSVDFILGLTDEPSPRNDKTLPAGTPEIIDYLSSMSDRGREQLLRIAKTIYEDDMEWRQREEVTKIIELVIGETEFASLRTELPAMIAEGKTASQIARSILNTIRQ